MHLSKETLLIIKKALNEDINTKDITTCLTIPEGLKGQGIIIAKEKGILCGIEIAEEIFKSLDTEISFKNFKKDGAFVEKGEKIAKITGNLRTVLTGERVALNFLSMLSGISTVTKKFVDKVRGTNVKILDTRKTTPNLRNLEKYAVSTGGGLNHRETLFHGILVKDNHLKASGCIINSKLDKKKVAAMIANIKKNTSIKIEIEVENISEFIIVADNHPNIIMLDNFTLPDLIKTIEKRNKSYPDILLEASGGITLKNVKKVARAGIDFISIGMLTHSTQALDFSLDIL